MFRPAGTEWVSGTALAIYVFLMATLAVEFLGIHAGIHFPLIGVWFIVVFGLYLFSGNMFRFSRTRFFRALVRPAGLVDVVRRSGDL